MADGLYILRYNLLTERVPDYLPSAPERIFFNLFHRPVMRDYLRTMRKIDKGFFTTDKPFKNTALLRVFWNNGRGIWKLYYLAAAFVNPCRAAAPVRCA